ncbi:MAG: hypothetical protein COT91_05005 [Candidatus Doudnabacteria bacterium CG10_big_fil_rev_8_21_14_0_10_41_10]|uniref:Uncharacterized protein n=1 Tax=Candidatus Doudnabacteria bacterium CG10_big_fil_rev_8_21_14_0_10_41_10 TaxID=1974551 RepID=A0A2H0VCE6_9BACT|nr:MAG: hypothetical protein COT91_05005 [Candidatus Doudnabacteria bacterium CG10_big_fil_rev_8_21_14_0_10_41_10]
MPNEQQYKDLISEIVKKQILILGPDVALLKAGSISGLKLDKEGGVVNMSGEQQDILQQLVDQYIELSGQIVKNVLKPVFAKYPSIKIDIK